MADFTTSIDIDAPPPTVFEYLVTNDGMTAWMGRWADLDPAPGGRFAVDIAGYGIRGEFLEIDPPHRVVVSWGITGDGDVPPGSSRVSITLTPTPTGTTVELVHSGLPDVAVAGHAAGWTHFVPRLADVASGTTPTVDTWHPLTRPITPSRTTTEEPT